MTGTLLPDLPAAVLIVQHLHPHHASVLAYLLGRHCPLEVRQAVHDDEIVGGIVYVAPPDMHLLVAGGRVELSRSKLVHYSRPSIDLLFESVAGSYGARAIGVVLTGSGVDGANGLRAIKGTGGTTVVQDPSTAAHRSMPQAAIATGCVDHVLALDEIGPALSRMAGPAPTTTVKARR